MYLRHGYEFIDQFFIQHHFQRYTSNKYLHPQPFYFFFWVLPLMTIPWLPFFIASLWSLGRRASRGSAEVTGRSPDRRSLELFAVAWLAVPLVFFSFSGSKLPGYILPAVPAAIILAADLIYSFVQKNTFRRFLVLGIAGATLAIVLILIGTVAPGFAEADSVKSLFAVAHARGLDGMPILAMHRVSHNAEFYASGPLIREPDGKQKRFFGSREVLGEMRGIGSSQVLVLIPPEYLHHLTQSDFVSAEVLRSNEEWALTLVTEK
jgi:4-amino-4-deoxy-L-arabinose transferase-like glycosyltransferase